MRGAMTATEAAPRPSPVVDCKPLLEVKGLRVTVGAGGRFDILHSVSFKVGRGQKIGLVGESGSGKSMTALAIMRLLPKGVSIASGSILFEGRDLAAVSAQAMRRIRGARIGMIFQDPMTSLNPVVKIGRQLTEGMAAHLGLSAKEREQRAIDLLARVKLPRPEQVYGSYPHVLSGGMRQRVAIAMALACRPQLIIADEPTTALDVTVQSEVIALLQEVADDFGTAVILISHSLDLVAEFCDRVEVMYAGTTVESGPTGPLIRAPRHPYTNDLISSSPDIELPALDRLPAIKGQPPAITNRPAGCAYSPRCRYVMAKCSALEPPTLGKGHMAACWLMESADTVEAPA
jgi:oligopeptide/dipeptide ABC transporter ATP-binding protein